MIDRLSNKLADALIASGNASNEDRDVYVYGLDVLLSTAANVICIIVLGAVGGRILETLIYMACFIGLRSAAGGYHASTHLRCFLIMLAAYFAAMAPTFLLGPDTLRITALPAAAVSLVVIAVFSPAPHENRPVSAAKLRRFRTISLWIAAGEAAASVLCFLLGLWAPAYAAAVGMLTSAGSLCAAHASAGRKASKEIKTT